MHRDRSARCVSVADHRKKIQAALGHARVRLQLALCEPTVRRLALGMTNSLAGQHSKIDCRPVAAYGLGQIFTIRPGCYYVSCLRLGGRDAHAQLMHKSGCMCANIVQPRILEVRMLRVPPEGGGECCLLYTSPSPRDS